MSTVEEFLTLCRELESIAINAPDAARRNAAMDERLNLHLILQREQQRSQNMEHALAEADGSLSMLIYLGPQKSISSSKRLVAQ